MDGPSMLISWVADTLGTSENAIRILISLFIGYPLAAVYRSLLYGRSASIQHVFFTVCGLWLCYFNFGFHVIHSVVNIILIYSVLFVIGGTGLSIVLAFIINMTYLCVGYYLTMTDSYTIKWTTPHCVLTLRLLGLVFDVYDGRRKQEQLSSEQKETALDRTPSLLEICGHSYFFGGFLVGPQFPMKRYQDFVYGRFQEKQTDGKPRSITPAMARLVAGISYTLIFQFGSNFLPDSLLTSDDFESMSYLKKFLVIVFWGKLTLYKYVGCWLIAEGVGILTGLTYNGKDENGNDLWDGCANIHIRDYETASTCHELIQSFNVNTNKWMAKYVFKRLKFLGNRDISQGATLAFLALWHGLYSGYFMNFFLEFVIIKFEKEAIPIFSSLSVVKLVRSLPGGFVLLWITKKLYAQFVLGYALISFCLFTFGRYWAVYKSLYFIGHICFILLWPAANYILHANSRKDRSSTNNVRKRDDGDKIDRNHKEA